MEKCARCKIKYPMEILSPVIGSVIKGCVCGICALEITNEIHGINEKKFQGEIAENFRLDAIKHRLKLKI